MNIHTHSKISITHLLTQQNCRYLLAHPPHTHSQTEFLVDFTWNLTLAEQWRQQIWARPGARIWAPGPPLVVIFGSWARPSEDWINSNSCAVPLGLDWEIVRHTYHSCCQRPQCCSSRSGSLSKASGQQVDRCHTETRQSTWGSISKTSLIRQSGLYCCLKKDGGRYMKRLQLTGERAPGWHLHTHAQMNTCRRESLVLKHQNVSRPRNCLENKEQLFF